MLADKTIIIKSETNGLWGRLITKLLATWVGLNYGFNFIFRAAQIYFNFWVAVLILLAFWVILGFLTYKMLRDNPLRWRNTVTFDLERQVIKIQKNKDLKIAQGIIDYESGRIIPFNEVKYISTEKYESFFFSAYYLLRLFKNDEEIKLLSIREPRDYSILLERITTEMKIPVK